MIDSDKKSILIISCVFPPEPVVSAKTSLSVANKLADLGHNVKVLSPFPSRTSGKLHKGYTRSLYKKDNSFDNFELIRCFSTLSSKSTMLSRFMENISFGMTSGIYLLFTKKPGVIYANTWPVFAMGLLVLIAKMKGVRIVQSVQDIYPESLISQGRISKEGLVSKTLYKIDEFISNNCSDIIVISKYFYNVYLDREVPKTKLHVVYNWFDKAAPIKNDSSRLFRDKLDLTEDTFLSVYGGNISAASGIQDIIQAFSKIEPTTNHILCIAGEGAYLNTCRNLVKELNIENIIFYSPWPIEETEALLSSADLLLLPTYGEQSLSSVPSKLISYMLSQKPVLALAVDNSDLKDVIINSNTGWVVPPGNIDDLSIQWNEIRNLNKDILKSKGISGHDYALENFSAEKNLSQLVNIITKD